MYSYQYDRRYRYREQLKSSGLRDFEGGGMLVRDQMRSEKQDRIKRELDVPLYLGTYIPRRGLFS